MMVLQNLDRSMTLVKGIMLIILSSLSFILANSHNIHSRDHELGPWVLCTHVVPHPSKVSLYRALALFECHVHFHTQYIIIIPKLRRPYLDQSRSLDQ